MKKTHIVILILLAAAPFGFAANLYLQEVEKSDEIKSSSTSEESSELIEGLATDATKDSRDSEPERYLPGKDVVDLEAMDLVKGEGEVVKKGDKISVVYVGWLASNGKVFDQGVLPSEGFPELVIGRGQVIPGWDLGIPGMREGGVRRLIIPSEMGYGATGAGDTIPPDADLVFEVQVKEIQ